MLESKVNWKRVNLENTDYYQFAAILRSIRIIQQSFRNWQLRSRVNCLIEIFKHVEQISDKDPLYLEQNIYLNLQSIMDQNSKNMFQERKFKFIILEGEIKLRFESKIKRYSKYSLTFLPTWLRLGLNLEIEIISDVLMRNRKQPSILAVLHNQHNLLETSVVDSNHFKPPVDKFMMTKKFVQFHFKNVDESKKIACLIALLTCNYLKGSTQFIHLMTASQLSSLGGVIK